MNEKEKKGIAYSMDFVNFVYKIGVYDQKIKHRGDGDMYLSKVMEDYKNQSQTVRVDDELRILDEPLDWKNPNSQLYNPETCRKYENARQITLTTLVSELQDKLDRQNEVIEWVENFIHTTDNSDGISGWHHNGELLYWGELDGFDHVKQLLSPPTNETICKHPRDKRTYIGNNLLQCGVCGKEFK